MTRARKDLVCIDSTPYYHCICRCVRRAYLCGDDKFTGKNFDHRKQWLVDKLTQLSSVFCIDICAYAIMSNHYHLVLHVDKAKAVALSRSEVAIRWMKLFKGHPLVKAWLSTQMPESDENHLVMQIIDEWRKRLHDLSWFMQCMNQYIAVKANQEDECSGRFWEGRYKSQALLDDTALLTCMAYVDLNPIRAGLASTPELSDFTSIQKRIRHINEASKTLKKPIIDSDFLQNKSAQPLQLLPFTNYESHNEKQTGLPFNLLDYLELVEWSGRIVRSEKSCKIPDHIEPILKRLKINNSLWQQTMNDFNRRFITAAGSVDNLKNWAQITGRKWCGTHGNRQHPFYLN